VVSSVGFGSRAMNCLIVIFEMNRGKGNIV
jgi:hypothetical protein